MRLIRSTQFVFLVLSLLRPGAAGAAVEEQPLAGHWEGTITRGAKEWRVSVDIREGGAAIVDLPDVGSFGVQFSCSIESAHVRLERKDANVPPITFDGWYTGGMIRGIWQGLGVSAEFAFTRAERALFDFREEEVRFRNGLVNLAGTFVLPVAPGRRPAIVCVHGSGAEGRTSPAYRSRAVFFARHGVATLIYDKRGVGASTGNWRSASFGDLAGDALAGVRLLRKRKDIDKTQIGLEGFSQGGWVAPLAAAKSKQIQFLILGAAPGVSPAEQSVFQLERQLRAEGYSAREIGDAVRLRERLYEEYRKGAPSAAFREEVERARQQRWFPAAGIPRPLPEYISAAEQGTLFFDPTPIWAKIKQPVLVMWGENDEAVPVERSRQVLAVALREAGNKDVTLRVFPQASHTLVITPTVSEAWDFPRAAPGYYVLMAGWLRAHVGKP